MKQAQHRLSVQTRGQGLYEVTGEIAAWLSGQGVGAGLLTVFIRHTSASLVIQENADPDVQTDLRSFFERLVVEMVHEFREVPTATTPFGTLWTTTPTTPAKER